MWFKSNYVSVKKQEKRWIWECNKYVEEHEIMHRDLESKYKIIFLIKTNYIETKKSYPI